MKHFLFECLLKTNYGEQFLVGATSLTEATQIAKREFIKVKFITELSEWEAENSGLDEW